MTSVSRSDHDDEAVEGTGAGASEQGGAPTGSTGGSGARSTSAGSSAGSKAGSEKGAAAKPAGSKEGGAKPASTTSKTAAMTPAERSAARSAAAKKAAATRKANKAAAAAAAAAAAEGESPSSTTAEASGSKRSGASRAASASASSARSAAARSTGATRSSSVASAAETRNRAAASASAHRQSQRVAASLTTETTAAERGPRKGGDAAAPAVEPAEAPAKDGAFDLEATTERKRTAATAAIAATEVLVHESDEAPAAGVTTPPADAVDPDGSAALAESSPAEAPGADGVLDDAPAAEASAPTIAAQAVTVIPAKKSTAPRKKRTLRVARPAPPVDAPRVLEISGLVKRFGENTAVDGISLSVRAGSFFGIVGPNGAGKTTTLSMVTGLLRPDAGTVAIHGIDAWADPRAAKRVTGVLPDRLRLFDRLTGSQLLYYSGVLRGLDNRTVRDRSADLISAFGLDDAVDRLVADYSAGMTKKIALACALIHSPRLLVLDEPFESVDPVSAANLTEILERYVAGGGTVVLSSHGMDLIERVCDSAAIIVSGRVLASGTLDEVRAGQTLEDRFVELAGGRKAAEGMEWLHSFSD